MNHTMTVSPSNPGQKGSSEVYQDGKPQSTNQAQFKKADTGKTIKETVHSENTLGTGRSKK